MAIKSALHAVATGGEVVFPAGTYMVSKDPSAAYSLALPGSNITLRGVKGTTWLKHVAGLPGNTGGIVILYIENVSHITLRDMVSTGTTALA